MFLDVPIAYCLVFAAYAAFAKQGDLMMLPISQSLASSVNSFILMSIPFFILAAHVMNASAITAHLIRFAAALVGHMRGGLAQVNVVTNTVMGGLSGSSLAVAVGTAKAMVPEMEKRGYPRPFAAAVTSCASTIDNLIPPSIGMIIFSAAGAVSVGALFTAGILPGLLMAAALMLMVHVQARRRGLQPESTPMSWTERMVACRDALPALMVPIFVVLGMRLGAFTASEAGAIAVVYAIVIGVFAYRQLHWRHLPEVLKDGVLDTVAIVAVVAASASVGRACRSSQAYHSENAAPPRATRAESRNRSRGNMRHRRSSTIVADSVSSGRNSGNDTVRVSLSVPESSVPMFTWSFTCPPPQRPLGPGRRARRASRPQASAPDGSPSA
jgi:C4-dicarboxylate transporter DctM subunit